MSIDNSSINGSSSVLDQYAINKDSGGTATAGKSNLGKDEFLKLLVAQMNNQDPMSPRRTASSSPSWRSSAPWKASSR